MRLWILNLDADEELDLGAPRALGAAALARLRASQRSLLGTLVPEGDLVDGEDARVPEAGAPGLAWCPTPSALHRLRLRGALPVDAPPVEVLRAVNHRRWAAERGLSLPRAAWVTDVEALRRHVASPWPAGGWLLRRPFGFAGRGRVRVRERDELEGRAGAWVASSLARDGLLVEPYVRRLEDFGLHGWVARGGEVLQGELTRQRCGDDGAWAGSARCEHGALAAGERDALREAFDDTARGLREAGYFGPFGVDAFAWDDDGARRFQPRCEVNARYSMGWSVGMGALRPDLALRAR